MLSPFQALPPKTLHPSQNVISEPSVRGGYISSLVNIEAVASAGISMRAGSPEVSCARGYRVSRVTFCAVTTHRRGIILARFADWVGTTTHQCNVNVSVKESIMTFGRLGFTSIRSDGIPQPLPDG